MDENVTCGVCMDIYDADDKIPRLLPCSHSFCEDCLLQIHAQSIIKRRFTCPICKTEHPIARSRQTKNPIFQEFPQNRYILSNLQHIQDQAELNCELHNEQFILYCKHPGCMKAICHKCVIKEHKLHEMVDLKEELATWKEEANEICTEKLTALNVYMNKVVKCEKELMEEKEKIDNNLDDVQKVFIETITTTIQDMKTTIHENYEKAKDCMEVDEACIRNVMDYFTEVKTKSAKHQIPRHDLLSGSASYVNNIEARLHANPSMLKCRVNTKIKTDEILKLQNTLTSKITCNISRVYSFQPSIKKVQILVMMDGKLLSMDIDPSLNIMEVKLIVKEKLNYDLDTKIDLQTLSGKNLPDDGVIDIYLANEKTLNLKGSTLK